MRYKDLFKDKKQSYSRDICVHPFLLACKTQFEKQEMDLLTMMLTKLRMLENKDLEKQHYYAKKIVERCGFHVNLMQVDRVKSDKYLWYMIPNDNGMVLKLEIPEENPKEDSALLEMDYVTLQMMEMDLEHVEHCEKIKDALSKRNHEEWDQPINDIKNHYNVNFVIFESCLAKALEYTYYLSSNTIHIKIPCEDVRHINDQYDRYTHPKIQIKPKTAKELGELMRSIFR